MKRTIITMVLSGLLMGWMSMINPVIKADRGNVVKTLHKINIYSSPKFSNAKVLGSYAKHKRVMFSKLVSVGGMTRFQLENGHYITANKRYVELLK
ncbi:DUF5776 domain-containing protein (plasmid) [Nicoliella spurrieriana]|uniref:DUF5776 domain-containing protein n=1 Tax=Nicoliella spurrieriana TaxID=2925830 RepID=A0A976X4V5_9LACO|nr:DUF5776 domain-containing protein [Nicoliella spurrieriana]UQS86129.1 DUF5776 domain-containing protein [Nicoliella spurrieriana]